MQCTKIKPLACALLSSILLFSSSSLNFQRVGRSRLRRSQSRRQHAEWRARHIIHPHLMAEFHRRWVAAVLTADSDFQLGTRLSPALDPDSHQFADAITVD